MERICICPGSYDPVTLGHLDVIERAARLFDHVIVAVLKNPVKAGWLPVESRLELLRIACRPWANVSVASFEGMTVDFAKAHGACAMVRGLRASGDFESERALAQVNQHLKPEIETVFLMGRPEHSHISSSAVREMASYGADLTGMVPREIMGALYRELERLHLGSSVSQN